MAKLSDELRQFLQEWLEWAEADAPYHNLFSKSTGLCTSCRYWQAENRCKIKTELNNLLTRLYPDAEWTSNYIYPFGGTSGYFDDSDMHIAHKNPQRLEFVRNVLANE